MQLPPISDQLFFLIPDIILLPFYQQHKQGSNAKRMKRFKKAALFPLDKMKKI